MIQHLMYKDIPVLEIENYNVRILDFEHLPYALRYPDVNYDDIFHGWTETRITNVGRTNAKKILNALRVSQNNLYALGKALHFVSVTDCFWINENESLTWNDVNLYKNPFSSEVSEIALFGTDKRITIPLAKLHTPEIATQGIAAKAWIWEQDGLYLYKVGKAEIPASQILDALQIDHVKYSKVPNSQLQQITTSEKMDALLKQNQIVVKSKCLCNEDISLISWEEFAVYADRNEIDAYKYIETNFKKEYAQMIIADYILGNDDRHVGNWGFLVDNYTGQIIKPYPLMDHDHAFNNHLLYCQTTETDMLLEDAAKEMIKKNPIDVSRLLNLHVDYLSEKDWKQVLTRCHVLEKYIPLKKQLEFAASRMLEKSGHLPKDDGILH